MQLNPQERINLKRLRTDAFASYVVTGFGLLVLAMFVLIILHMLSNAFPLLHSPSLNLSKRIGIDASSPVLSVQHMGDEAIAITYDDCKVQLHQSGEQRSEIMAEFHHPCTSRFIPVQNEQAYEANYALMRESGLIEIFNITHLASMPERTLLGSFNISNFSEVEQNLKLRKASWRISKYGNNVALFSQIEGQRAMIIWHRLNQLDAATFQIIEQVDSFLPLPRFKHALVVYQGQTRLINQSGAVLQVLSENTAVGADILSSPNQRSIYIPASDGSLQVWQNVNVEGEFLFAKLEAEEKTRFSQPKHMVFDRQTMIAVLSHEPNMLSIINSASNEVVNTETLTHEFEHLLWHDGNLFIYADNQVYIYELENPAGITTWKSLFAKVQYAGYDSAQYIWQTSQSAEYAETKFSLIPLIIGSLKASVLALFVAIPLALGAAIYTAYFASSEVRSWVKPSIEMIEAIPSVIIGFVAAVWLAPFAERSLIALLGTTLCLPGIILLLAYLQAKFSQTEFKGAWEKYAIVIISVLFLLLLFIVFQTITLLQGAIFQGSTINEAAIVSDFTMSKTTVVVALALGVAVAPTIYSLVDDALFEVPEGVKQASFALGATELQTLVKVVLVVALPSIISAIMLGLGRAFGETMIVLMVTGNTPIADWDLLSGLRSLTSNLTIELQEASVDSAHYHILFLTAVILFAFTFAINTIAALLKRRLQRGNSHA